MTTVDLTVTIGSQLHGLATPSSDIDTANVVRSELIELLSPFRTISGKQTQSNSGDETTYELTHFCKLAANGNPTILEVLWSNQVRQVTDVGIHLQLNRNKFLNSEAIFRSHLGYAESQLRRYNYDVSNLRRGKAAAAYIRVLLQAQQLLTKHTFSPQITKHIDLLKTLKQGVDVDYIDRHVLSVMDEERKAVMEAYENCSTIEPDILWIEKFLVQVYR